MPGFHRRVFDDVLTLGRGGQLRHVAVSEPRPATHAPLPDDLDPRLWSALVRVGVTELYSHQRSVWDAARRGEHAAVVTGTASGKTLAYALPVLDRLLADRHARVIYLSPTKALAQDQARTLRQLGLGRGVRPALYDGDTDPAARGVARTHANLLLTNPDMLHAAIVPRAERWGDWFANLAFVVIDEAHVYRGVFGSHVANVIRRLRRVCAAADCHPQFLLASATVANPQEAAAALVGAPVAIITDDGAPRPARTVALWNPTLLDATTGQRASALAEAAALVAELVARDQRVICFARTRRSVEVTHRVVRDTLAVRAASRVDGVAPYRAGYTPTQRRDLEARLAAGALRAIIATNALELGIDIGLLDCAVTIGFPGTVASLRQQWGRAGRAGDGLAVLVASPDALDQYFVRHPDALLDRPVEAVILDPASPRIRDAHLVCAAYEAPITDADDAILGDGSYQAALRLCEHGDLRYTRAGLVYTRGAYPAAAVGLRSATSEVVVIVDASTGQLLGTVETSDAPRTVHEGAVYLHLGEAYAVTRLDLDRRVAEVEPFTDDWYTQAKTATTTTIDAAVDERIDAGVRVAFGDVAVTEQVLAYQRRRLPRHEVIDTTELAFAPSTFPTQALWFTVPAALLGDDPEPLGTLHAAEHALISVLPLHAMCDRWDIGGLSTNQHPQTGQPTIIIYDAYPGGIGLSRQGFRRFRALVSAAHDVIRTCPCQDGCPSCVQSPKCGNLNEPLNKHGAQRLLFAMLADC